LAATRRFSLFNLTLGGSYFFRAQIFPNAVVVGCFRFNPSKVTILHGQIVRFRVCDSTFFSVDLLSAVVSTVRL
jgi:hypothetical protein